MTELLVGAGPRRQESLKRLKAACDDLARQGPFRLKDIERHIVERHGRDAGPKAQSISNEKHLQLGMYRYVEARQREVTQARVQKHQRDQRRASIYHQIEAIADIDLRNMMRDVYDRMLTAEATAGRAKHLLKTTRPGVDIDALLQGREQATASIISAKAVETLHRLRSILTNEERLSCCGLMLDHGQVRQKRGTGDELIPAIIMRDFLDFCALLETM